MADESLRPNKSESIEFGSKQNKITSLETSVEQAEHCSTIDYDYSESSLIKTGASSAPQGIAKTESNKLGDNVAAASSFQPTGEPDNIIDKTTNHNIKESHNIKSSTKATIIIIVVIVAVGVASSAITVAVKDMNSSRQDNDQLNSGTKIEKQTDNRQPDNTDILTLNLCNGSVLTLIANDTTATLMSHGYLFSNANNLPCNWLIDSGIGGQSIAVYLEHYNVKCSYGDSFSMYDGSSTSDYTLVNSACGRNNATQLYISSGKHVLVTFTTDSTNHGQSFLLSYFNIPDKSSYTCPVYQLSVSASETPAKLTPPGYPFKIANYLSCTWLIDSGVDGQVIALYVEMCKMTGSYGQVLTIYDSSTFSNSKLLYFDCKHHRSADWSRFRDTGLSTSSNRYALVSFETLSANQAEGFQLSYVSAPDTSATGCSSTYTLTASINVQYLTSEGLPSHYSSNSNCSWLINADDRLSTISIDIVWSDIEYRSGCKLDYLKIYDGNSFNDSTLMTNYCNRRTDPDVTPFTYISTSNNILVLFVSDRSKRFRGFIMKYSVTLENITRP